MSYIIRLMNKSEVEITDKEYANLAGKSGLVHIPSQDRIVNTNSIVEILNSEMVIRESEGKNNLGTLHDGLQVIRHFGEWYLRGEMMEVGGKLVPAVVIDRTYYPEVAGDCVPTDKEYREKYAKLPEKERLKAIMGKDFENIRINGFESLKEISERKNNKLIAK